LSPRPPLHPPGLSGNAQAWRKYDEDDMEMDMDVDLEKLPRHLRAEAEQTITVARPKSMAAPIGDIHARGHMHPEDLDELDWAEAERAAVPKQMPTKGKGHSLKGLGRAMLMAPRRDADDEDAEESEYYSGSPYVMERGVPGLPRPPLAPPRGAIASPSASGPHPPSSLPPHMAKGKQDQWDDEQWDDEQWSDEQQDDWNYRANAMQEVKQASTHPWNDRKFWDREDEDSWEEDDQQLIKDAEEGLTVVPKGMAARPPRGAPPVAKAKMMQAAPKHKIAPSSAPIIPSRMDARSRRQCLRHSVECMSRERMMSGKTWKTKTKVNGMAAGKVEMLSLMNGRMRMRTGRMMENGAIGQRLRRRRRRMSRRVTEKNTLKKSGRSGVLNKKRNPRKQRKSKQVLLCRH